jgi:hypothetical protein
MAREWDRFRSLGGGLPRTVVAFKTISDPPEAPLREGVFCSSGSFCNDLMTFERSRLNRIHDVI